MIFVQQPVIVVLTVSNNGQYTKSGLSKGGEKSAYHLRKPGPDGPCIGGTDAYKCLGRQAVYADGASHFGRSGTANQ
ncbi:Uncharacterised protein [Chlamydia trachomatis]|nr:Uncharacterised protein [Chlamydia trachomatis]